MKKLLLTAVTFLFVNYSQAANVRPFIFAYANEFLDLSSIKIIKPNSQQEIEVRGAINESNFKIKSNGLYRHFYTTSVSKINPITHTGKLSSTVDCKNKIYYTQVLEIYDANGVIGYYEDEASPFNRLWQKFDSNSEVLNYVCNYNLKK